MTIAPSAARMTAGALVLPKAGNESCVRVMEMPDIESLLGVKAIFVKAGTAGAIVGAVVQRTADWRDALARFVAGVCCAAYLTPLPVRWLGVTDDYDRGAMAFCVGIGGMGLTMAIIALLKDPLGSWSRFKGGGGPA